MCVGVWRRSPDSLVAEGTNGCALFSPSDDSLAVCTTRHVLNVLRVREINGEASSGAPIGANGITLGGGGARSAEVCSFPDAPWHDESTLNAPLFHPIHLQLYSRVKLANDYIACACGFGDDILMGTRAGYIQVVGWDGAAKICVDALACATSSQAAPSAENPTTPDPAAPPVVAKPSIVQIATSTALGMVAFVFSDGSAGVCDTALLRPNAAGPVAPAAGSGMLLLPGGPRLDEHATRVSFNCRYRLLAVGIESGDVLVYRVDAQAPLDSWTPAVPSPLHVSFLRRYSIGAWGFTAQDVGVVQCMEWSPDGSVLAVGWSGRGLVVWSTGGTRVACTLPMLSPLASLATGTPMPSPASSGPVVSAHATPRHHLRHGSSSSVPTVDPPTELLGNGVTALVWGCAGASLLVSGQCNETTHGFGAVKLKSKSWSDVSNDTPNGSPSSAASANGSAAMVLPSAEARCGCGLVTRLSFVRSCLGSNPSQNEQTSLALLGEDRIVLWAGKRALASAGSSGSSSSDRSEDETIDDLLHANWVPAQSEDAHDADGGGDPRGASSSSSDRHARAQANEDRFLDSDADWEHIQLPVVYLRHAWPVLLCAISASGLQIACAGSQGLILYNRTSSFTSGSAAAGVAPHLRKWRSFGNVNHEAAVHPAALAWYGEHIVCVASRGVQPAHHPVGRTSRWAPPPAAAAKRRAPGAASSASAASSSSPDDSIELLFYPRSHLDNSSLLHAHVLSNASSFHSLDISDHTLMVYLSIGQLLIYKLRAEVHVNPHAAVRKQTTPQAAMLSQVLSLAGMKTTTPSGGTPYSTAPHAHDTLGMEHELRMSMELAYVVDLCAPLAPIRSMAPQDHHETASLLAALSTPPLQCRLWLSAADSLEQAEELAQSSLQAQPSNSSVAPSPDSSSLVAEQVYELPLFCPNSQPQALEALFQATTPNPGHARRLSKSGSGVSVTGAAAASKGARKVTKVLSCIILTSTGTLLAVDIGSSMRVADRSIYSPSAATPNPTASPSASSVVSHPGGSSTMVAWVRMVSSNVEQFWLHEMSAVDPTLLARQYLHSQQQTRSRKTKEAAMVAASGAARQAVRGFRLFSYGSSGLDVWFRLSSSGARGPLAAPPAFQANKLLDFDPEVYPLGLDSSIGVIVGITKGLRTRAGTAATMAQTPHSASRTLLAGAAKPPSSEDPSPFWGPVVCFRLQTQLQPYLHGVLMHLVTNEHAAPVSASSAAVAGTDTAPAEQSAARQAQLQYAFHIANSCRTHEYFSVALELLLHTALNPPSSAAFLRSHRSASLGSVVAFLRRFPEFPDIVINCARKNDASSWPRLFQEAGTPLQLFDLCLRQSKLRMASCYLIVIQRTSGMVAAREAATTILQRIEQDECQRAMSRQASNGLSSNSSMPNRSPSPLVHSDSLTVPPSLPRLTASPSITFHRRRRLSALEGELQRFIALTHGMEREVHEQQQKAAQEAAAAAAAAARRGAAAAPTTALPHVSPARRSNPSTPIRGAALAASAAAPPALDLARGQPAAAVAPPPAPAPADDGCRIS